MSETKEVRSNERKRRATSEEVVRRLRKMILRGELKPGDRLPSERDFAKLLGVSRPSLRAGIHTLQAFGLLQSRQGSGTFVIRSEGMPATDVDAVRLVEILRGFSADEISEARTALELSVSELAAERATGEQLASLAEEVTEMFAAIDEPENFLVHDARFHQTLAASSGNPILNALASLIGTLLSRRRGEKSYRGQDLKEWAERQRRLYRCVRDRNPEDARRAMREHLLQSKAERRSGAAKRGGDPQRAAIYRGAANGAERKTAKILRSVLFLVSFSLVSVFSAFGQEFIPLYPAGKMPNSKGMALKDDIRSERIYQVGTPGMYAFFPSRQENKGAAVVICPGGGYERLAYVIAGTQMAKWFNTLGVSAFVLNYRLPNSPDLVERQIAPLQDAQRALRIIRANAGKWQIKPDKIGIFGTSAGGHLAALTALATPDVSARGDEFDKAAFTPNFMILVSPVITMGEYAHAGSKKNLLGENPSRELIDKYSLEKQVTAAAPPAFIVHAFDDRSVSPRNSVMFFAALLEKNVPASLHIFPQGGHAIALRNNPGSTGEWTNLCELWLTEMGFIPPVKK